MAFGVRRGGGVSSPFFQHFLSSHSIARAALPLNCVRLKFFLGSKRDASMGRRHYCFLSTPTPSSISKVVFHRLEKREFHIKIGVHNEDTVENAYALMKSYLNVSGGWEEKLLHSLFTLRINFDCCEFIKKEQPDLVFRFEVQGDRSVFFDLEKSFMPIKKPIKLAIWEADVFGDFKGKEYDYERLNREVDNIAPFVIAFFNSGAFKSLKLFSSNRKPNLFLKLTIDDTPDKIIIKFSF